MVIITRHTVRAFHHGLSSAPRLSVGQTELQFEHKDGAPVNQPISSISNAFPDFVGFVSLCVDNAVIPGLDWPLPSLSPGSLRFVFPGATLPGRKQTAMGDLASWSSGLRLAHNGCPKSTYKCEWKNPSLSLARSLSTLAHAHTRTHTHTRTVSTGQDDT